MSRLSNPTLLFVFANCFLGLLVPGAAGTDLELASPESVGIQLEKLQKIEDTIQKHVAAQEITGISLIVGRHGKIFYNKSFGYCDHSRQAEMHDDSIVRLYSMSKPLTTVAAVKIWEEGGFKLNDPVSKYIPAIAKMKVGNYENGELNYRDAKTEMTVQHLMQHTSGLSYGLAAFAAFSNSPFEKMYAQKNLFDPNSTLNEFAEKLSELPLASDPGVRWRYSCSIDLLGHVLEKVEGKPLDEVLEEKLFKPLGMEDTGFYVPPEKADRLAAVHSKMPGLGTIVIRPSQSSPYLEKPDLLLGGSNMVSTARDYARFLQMIMNNGRVGDTQYLKAETVERMTTNQLPEALVDRRGRERRLGQGFGLGFAVRVELSSEDKASRVGEFGWGGAANTYFFCDKLDDMFVVLIRQSMPMSLGLEAELKPLLQEAVIHTKEEQAKLDALEEARKEQQEKSRAEQRKQLSETLAKIDAAEVPIDYSPKHHQEWVDRMQGSLNSRGRGAANALWQEKRRLEPELENRGQYYAKILDFLTGIPKFRDSN